MANKDKDSNKQQTNNENEFLTTDQGVRVSDNQNSLKAGSRGPTLMEDFILREKITHFDHERIPERVVHARGSGAHGVFQVYESMAKYTKASFLQDPSVQTPVFVRFSTVGGSRGSADTVRDVRGFATKFYTDAGNYDLVGNNMPVFFIQDAIKFPDLIHAVKPEPDHEMPQASSAHTSFYDFISLTPESTHMMMWLMSDRALPRSYRLQEGFGVHTFRFINEQGKSHFVKFHWKPVLGMHSMAWDETQILAGKDPDFNRRDLWESIEEGNFPEYELGVQIVDEGEEGKLEFDILDATKLWPEEEVPVKIIGKMTLNRNPDNFFAETEQVAFHTANIVPGIDFTDDPLLQGRHFSYLDTQLIRLGGPNFAQLPINRPRVDVKNNQQDGYMRTDIRKSRINYEPNSFGGFVEAPVEQGGFASYPEKTDAEKIRKRSETFADHFTQAKLFWNSQSDAEKNHIVKAFTFELSKVDNKDVRERMLNNLANVDTVLTKRIAAGLGMAIPSATEKNYTKESKALSIERNPKGGIKTKLIAILATDGFNAEQLNNVKTELEKGGAKTKIISNLLGTIKGSDGKEVNVDMNILTVSSVLFDAVFIPGGKDSVATLTKKGDIINFVKESYRHCKAIGATSEAIDILKMAEVGSMKFSDDKTMSEDGIVTAKDNSDISNFGKSFVEAISQDRHWIRESKDIRLKFDS